jgi:hypothetical protein
MTLSIPQKRTWLTKTRNLFAFTSIHRENSHLAREFIHRSQWNAMLHASSPLMTLAGFTPVSFWLRPWKGKVSFW